MTVIRFWRGPVYPSRIADAIRHETELSIPGYRKIPGNQGAYMLGRDLGKSYELAHLTLWDTYDAVRAFAGDRIELANYDEYRRHGFDFMMELPEKVEHFDVLVSANWNRSRKPAMARMWRGTVLSSDAEEYKIYQEEVGPPNYEKIPGNMGIYMLGRDLGNHYEITMLTFWESLESIRAFAGDPVDKARYYDRDFNYLIDPPEKVEHFEILVADVQAYGFL